MTSTYMKRKLSICAKENVKPSHYTLWCVWRKASNLVETIGTTALQLGQMPKLFSTNKLSMTQLKPASLCFAEKEKKLTHYEKRSCAQPRNSRTRSYISYMSVLHIRWYCTLPTLNLPFAPILWIPFCGAISKYTIIIHVVNSENGFFE